MADHTVWESGRDDDPLVPGGCTGRPLVELRVLARGSRSEQCPADVLCRGQDLFDDPFLTHLGAYCQFFDHEAKHDRKEIRVRNARK